MVRALWFTGLVAALAQAGQELSTATISFDTEPRVIDDSGATLAVLPGTLRDTSPLLNSTGIEKRKGIKVVVAVATAAAAGGTVIIAAKAVIDIYEFIALKIKAKSNQNSCTLTYGTDSDNGVFEGYAFQATTTGSNCDTTAIYETILNAVESCANSLSNAHAVRGCCRFSHGGTWTGHLQLTADPDNFPATDVAC